MNETTREAVRTQARSHRARLLSVLRVQYPDALADRGYRLIHPTTGDPYAGDRRHLIATCRSVANFAVGALADGPDWCLDAAEHGLQFLREAHRADDGGITSSSTRRASRWIGRGRRTATRSFYWRTPARSTPGSRAPSATSTRPES